MDAISALLSTYLSASAQAIGNAIGKEAFSHMDPGQTESVEYQGFKITFTHQLWKIQDSSVCRTYKNNVTKLDQCTHAAKDLFIQTCDKLTAERLYHPDYQSLKRMYCTAAETFQPTQARMEWAEPTTPDADARQKCRLAQAAVLAENTPENRHLRKEACQNARAVSD